MSGYFLQTKPLEALSINLPIHAQVSNPSSLMLAKPSNGLLFSLGKIETFFFGIWHARADPKITFTARTKAKEKKHNHRQT